MNAKAVHQMIGIFNDCANMAIEQLTDLKREDVKAGVADSVRRIMPYDAELPEIANRQCEIAASTAQVCFNLTVNRLIDVVGDFRNEVAALVSDAEGTNSESSATEIPDLITAEFEMPDSEMPVVKGRLLEVLYYLCKGYSYNEIAKQLCISENTVRKDYVPKLCEIFKIKEQNGSSVRKLIAKVAEIGMEIPEPQQSSVPGVLAEF